MRTYNIKKSQIEEVKKINKNANFKEYLTKRIKIKKDITKFKEKILPKDIIKSEKNILKKENKIKNHTREFSKKSSIKKNVREFTLSPVTRIKENVLSDYRNYKNQNIDRKGQETEDILRKQFRRRYFNPVQKTVKKVAYKHKSNANLKNKQTTLARKNATLQFKNSQIGKNITKKTYKKNLKEFNRINKFRLRNLAVGNIKNFTISNIKLFLKTLIAGAGKTLLMPLLLIGIIIVIVSSVLTIDTPTVEATSKIYMSNKDKLIEANNYFQTLENNLKNENNLKQKYYGYNEYEIDTKEVKHNAYHLLSLLNIVYRDYKEINKDMKELMRDTFNKMYEIRTQTEEKEKDGKKIKVIKIKITKKYELEKIAKDILKNYAKIKYSNEKDRENILNWYDELNKNQGGVSELFGSSVVGSNVNVAGVINREKFNKENSDFSEPKLNRIDPNGSGYAFGQCTWYAFQRRSEIGKPLVHSYFGNGGDWWKTAQSLGMTVNKTPRAGACVSFPGGVAGAYPPWGHVAFVEKVNSDGSFEVSEMSGGYTVDGIIRYRHLPKEVANYVYFIH